MVVGFYLYLYVIFLSIFLTLKPRKNSSKKPLFSLFKRVECPSMKQKNLEKKDFTSRKNEISWIHDEPAKEISLMVKNSIADHIWKTIHIRYQIRYTIKDAVYKDSLE